LNVFVVVNAFHAPCAGVPVPVNKRQLCTGSHALDTAYNESYCGGKSVVLKLGFGKILRRRCRLFVNTVRRPSGVMLKSSSTVCKRP